MAQNGQSQPPTTAKRQPLTADEYQTFLHIAKTLDETQKAPRAQLMNIMRICGKAFCEEMLNETLRIESEGGMQTLDRTKRRTAGGVFFYLARSLMTDEQRNTVFSPENWSKRKPQWRTFDWSRRHKAISRLKAYGKVEEMRVTLIGSPGQMSRAADVIITKMTHEASDLSLPGGLPPIPAHEMVYTVYIAKQQWEQVEPKLDGKQHHLVVEGQAFIDPDVDGITVFATRLKTRKIARTQKVKHIEVKTEPTPEATSDTVDKVADDTLADASSKLKTVDPASKPTDMTALDSKRYDELMTAVEQFRKKIAEIEEKPPEKRTGEVLTRKLLANTEKQLTALREKYAQSAK